MNLSDLKFPHAIDNTMRAAWAKCNKIVHWKHELGLNEVGSRWDLLAGAAFATGVETWRKAYYQNGKSEDLSAIAGIQAIYKALEGQAVPKDTNKTPERMAGALAFYANERTLLLEDMQPLTLPTGKRAIEVSFNETINIEHPDGESELTYCGRFDALMIDANNRVWVVDEKTTGSLGPKWGNQWDLDGQMTGYIWGAKKFLKNLGIDCEVAGAIVNGVAIKKYDYEQIRIYTMRQPWEVERWFVQLQKDVAEWKVAYDRQDHNQVFNHICAMYNNPCEFAKLCKSGNPERLYGSYVVRFWNPLERDDK